MRGVGRYGTAGLELVVGMGIGFFGGRWLDQRFGGGHGYFVIGGVIFGLVAGFRNLFRAAKNMQKDLEREESEAFPYEREYLAQVENGKKADKAEADKAESESKGKSDEQAGS